MNIYIYIQRERKRGDFFFDKLLQRPEHQACSVDSFIKLLFVLPPDTSLSKCLFFVGFTIITVEKSIYPPLHWALNPQEHSTPTQSLDHFPTFSGEMTLFSPTLTSHKHTKLSLLYSLSRYKAKRLFSLFRLTLHVISLKCNCA